MRKLKVHMYECDVNSIEIDKKLGGSYSYESSKSIVNTNSQQMMCILNLISLCFLNNDLALWCNNLFNKQ